MKIKKNNIWKIFIFISILLISSAFGWTYIQKGVMIYYKNELSKLFEEIEQIEKEYWHKNNMQYIIFAENGKILPKDFNKNNSAEYQNLIQKISESKYFDFNIFYKNKKKICITAYLKSEILKNRWYFINSELDLSKEYCINN